MFFTDDDYDENKDSDDSQNEEEEYYQFGQGEAQENGEEMEDDEAPSFSLKARLNTKLEQVKGRGNFVSFAAAQGHLIIGTTANYVLRWNVEEGTITQARLDPKHRVTLSKVFAAGPHVVVTTAEGSTYSINFRSSKKPKPAAISSLGKGMLVSAMAARGGKVLVGTRQGDLYDLDLYNTRKAVKVFSLTGDSGNAPVLDIEMETFPSNPDKFLICVVTSNKLYEFVATSSFEASFKKYYEIQARNPGSYTTELPGNCDTSEIKFHSEHGSANTLAWITEPGIFTTKLEWRSQEIGDKVSSGSVILQPDLKRVLSIAVTPITVLCLGHSEADKELRVTAINRLSQAVRPVGLINKTLHGQALQLTHIPNLGSREPASAPKKLGRNFLLCSTSVLEVEIQNEAKELSGIYLSRQEFTLAKAYAKDDTQRQLILATEAQHLFDRNFFSEAAEKYAELTTNYVDPALTFEEIALKFVNHNADDALLKFLQAKLKRTPAKDNMQRTILASWIVENLLAKMQKVSGVEREEATQKLNKFLKDHANDLEKDSTIELISSHGQQEQLLHFAECQKDSRFIVESRIQAREYQKAVEELKKRPTPEDIYFFAPTLMNRATAEFTELLMLVPTLDSKRLLPALQKCNSERSDYVIMYLEHLIKNRNREPAIHNYLASLYAHSDKNEDRLLHFIKSQQNDPIFDLKFILRICHEEQHPKSCCAVYKILGLHEAAVKVALQHDELELAKEIAKEIRNDKKLWLLIARHVIGANDINAALDIVRISDLNIEDILPHLPDFVKMKNFKKEVLESLENHNKQIEKLKQALITYTTSADHLRADIERQTRKPVTCHPGSKCDLSGKPILGHKFMLFPCTHVFRVSALRDKLREYADVIDPDQLDSECPLCGSVMVEETSRPL